MRPYHPSIKCTVIFVRVFVASIVALLAMWSLSGFFNDRAAATIILGFCIFLTVMGAWHDGYAFGEKKGRESGNVLFFILLGIVLLAGLTAAMNQGSRTSTGMVTDQEARLMAAEIIQYAGTVRQVVNRLQMQGCSQDDLNFANDKWKRLNGNAIIAPNANAPTDGSCDVFGPDGGGIGAESFPQASLSPTGLPSVALRPGNGDVSYYTVNGVGTGARDLVFITNLVRKEVCRQINRMMDINLEEIPTDTGGGFKLYDAVPELSGKNTACTHAYPSGWSDESYYVWHVLIAN